MTVSYKVEIEINEVEKELEVEVILCPVTELFGRYGDFERLVGWEVDDIEGDLSESEKEEILHHLQNVGFDHLMEYIEEIKSSGDF